MSFDVTSIAGNVLWLNTLDPTTVTTAPVGTTTTGLGNVANATQITTWFDRSPVGSNTNDATQSTTLIQPTYFTSGWNGIPYLSFNTAGTSVNGAGARIVIANPAFLSAINNGSYSFTFVYRQNSGSSASFQVLAENRANANAQFAFLRFNGHFSRYNLDPGAVAALSLNVGHIITYTFQQTSGLTGTETFFIDGVQVFQTTDTLPSMGAFNTFSIGGSLQNDVNGYASDCLAQAQFQCVAAFDHSLTTSERIALESGLGTDYSISVGSHGIPLTAGVLSASSVLQNSQTINSTPPTGGTAPITQQLYQSTASGVQGASVAGATTLSTNITSLTAQTNYYYTMVYTDSASPPAVVYSVQLLAPTQGNTGINVGFMGDSISTLIPPGSLTNVPQAWVNLLQAYNPALAININNQAHAGQTVRGLSRVNGGNSGITTTIANWVGAGFQPAYVMWMEGTNDAFQLYQGTAGYSLAQFILDIADVVAAIHTAFPLCKVIVNDIPYRNQNATVLGYIRTFNADYVALAAANPSYVVVGSTNDYSTFAANLFGLTTDGLHPNAAGVTLMATNWFNPTAVLIGGAPASASYSVVAPSSGIINAASANFVVTPAGTLSGTLVVTPVSNIAGDFFTPSSLTFTSNVPQNFTLTPFTLGPRTITYTHTGGGFLGDPASSTFTSNPSAGPPPFALCQPTQFFGTPGAWSDQSAYTQIAEVDDVQCLASSQTWQPTGVQVMAGESLSVIAGGEAQYELFQNQNGFYCYPEGSYPGGAQHMDPVSSGPAPDTAFHVNPFLSQIGNAQSLAIAITPTNVAPTWTGNTNSGLFFPGRSAIILSNNINGGAGGFVWVCLNDNQYNDNGGCFRTSFRRLVPSGGGGGPALFNFVTSEVGGLCYGLITINLTDLSGNPAPVPAGQQQIFTAFDNNNGTFNPPNPLIITAGLSSVQTAYSNPIADDYLITITPGPGPLTANAPYPPPQTVAVSLSCGTGDTTGCLCSITRPFVRDAIRRRLFGYAPVDNGGLPGAEPIAASFPLNSNLNQCITDGIRELNRVAKFNTTVNLSIKVPPVSPGTIGPQFINLQGIIGCPTQSALNTVRRMVYTDSTGTPTYYVYPTTFTLEDRLQNPFDNVPPTQPITFFIVGYMIGLLPGSVNGGTLSLYAGTAVPQFCSDSDTIAELSSDYQEIIEYAALMKLMESPMGRRLFGDESLAIYAGKFNDPKTGWPSIAGLQSEATEEYTPSFGWVSNRNPSRLGNSFRRRWGGR